MGLMLMSGSTVATRKEIAAVPVPKATRSWRPVPYIHAIHCIEELVVAYLGAKVVGEQYGLNKAGQQMFGLLTVQARDRAEGLTIGVRQSYNKTLALGVAVGTRVFVCDNLCFSGDAFKVVRKNTTNVWPDFQKIVQDQLHNAFDHQDKMAQDIRQLQTTACNQRRGYSFLGVLQGEGLLSAQQATVAINDWRKPRHEEFKPRNMWSLYNCVTEGLKKGAPGRIIDRHVAAHSFFMEAAA